MVVLDGAAGASGWPQGHHAPMGFGRSSSTPNARAQVSGIEANASSTSNEPMSSGVTPCCGEAARAPRGTGLRSSSTGVVSDDDSGVDPAPVGVSTTATTTATGPPLLREELPRPRQGILGG